MKQANSEQSDNCARALERVAEVVEKWEALPDRLPDIDGIVPLSQAIIDLRGLVREHTLMSPGYSQVPGSQVTAAFITPECRINRGDLGAWEEAVARLRAEYDEILTGWGSRPDQPTLNLILTMERP